MFKFRFFELKMIPNDRARSGRGPQRVFGLKHLENKEKSNKFFGFTGKTDFFRSGPIQTARGHIFFFQQPLHLGVGRVLGILLMFSSAMGFSIVDAQNHGFPNPWLSKKIRAKNENPDFPFVCLAFRGRKSAGNLAPT